MAHEIGTSDHKRFMRFIENRRRTESVCAMLATYAASRHRQIVPCCMISSVSHDNVSRLVTDRSMCFATALDKAFENIDCMSAILRCQAKNRFYESTQRLIQPRRVLWSWALDRLLINFIAAKLSL